MFKSCCQAQMCFRQRQTATKETKSIWKDSTIIMKRGPGRIMRLLQLQGNKEQSLVCCLARQSPAQKQIHEETSTDFRIQTNVAGMMLRHKVTGCVSLRHLAALLYGHCSDSSLHSTHFLHTEQILALGSVCRYSAPFSKQTAPSSLPVGS